MKPILTIFVLCIIASPALSSADLSGEFRFLGNDCSAEPVEISPERLNMGHVQCTFSNNTQVEGMPAELRDATCDVEGELVETRYFISRMPDGLIVFSPELGAEFFVSCH